jgi:IMP dehydrogenase
MATLADLPAFRETGVITVQAGDTVRHAADIMNERNIGAVLVLDGEQLAGIFTERDVLRRVVASGRDPEATPVRAVMSAPVITCHPDLSIDAAAALMTSRGVRHLPVRDASGLKAMVSIRDLLAHQVGEQQATITQMNNYLYDLR